MTPVVSDSSVNVSLGNICADDIFDINASERNLELFTVNFLTACL